MTKLLQDADDICQILLQPISDLSKSLAEKLVALNIRTYWDILLHVPLRYEDLTKTSSIEASVIGSSALVEGEIISCEVIHKRTRQLQVVVYDKTAYITLIFLHFYPNYKTQYQVGKSIRAYGEVKAGFAGSKTMFHPKIKSIKEDVSLEKTFSPIYPMTNGLVQAQIIKVVNQALTYLDEIENKFGPLETLPESIIDSQLTVNNTPDQVGNDRRSCSETQLMGLSSAIRTLHKLTPQEFAGNKHIVALKRLKMDELMAQQLILLNIYRAKHKEKSQILKPRATYTKELFTLLPFKLTNAQTRVLGEIYADIAKPTQMNRLLQGDVGSGKTIVAAFAMLVAVENGCQACIVAPTEILAEQHYLKIRQLLSPLDLNITWLSGSLTPKQKREAYAKIEAGEAQIVIGTHAVIQKDVNFKNLALIVVDEQHRFGVEQRLVLQAKGDNPHQLMMSATPIPRSLAMGYYADLDVSTIDELPPGRTPVETILVNNNRRHEVISFVKKALIDGAQIYWVCPLIEESENLDLENAINTYNELTEILKPVTVGLIHGKLKSSEKAAVMEEFKAGQIQVLVATTVIEVGVDVPNASIMVIEHSERMGLAQLHQLRGRVGRGKLQSKCVLLYHYPLSEVAKRRLKAIHENSDGFVIAHEDLLIRGPGEILGSRQSGLPILKFADLETDLELLQLAKKIAPIMLSDFPDYAKNLTKLWFHHDEQFLKT